MNWWQVFGNIIIGSQNVCSSVRPSSKTDMTLWRIINVVCWSLFLCIICDVLGSVQCSKSPSTCRWWRWRRMSPSAHIITHHSRHNFLIARKIFEIDVLGYFEQMFWVSGFVYFQFFSSDSYFLRWIFVLKGFSWWLLRVIEWEMMYF